MLNTKQAKFIPEFIKTGSVNKACNKAKIDRQTYYNWMKEEEFASELKKQQDALYNGALAELESLFNTALNAFKDLINSEDESIKFRTAKEIIDNITKQKDNRAIIERLEALEQALEEKG
jgi:phage terminase small subunit